MIYYFNSYIELEEIIDESSESSPLFYLNLSIYNVATAIKFKPKDVQAHLKLAMLLEEKHLFESFYGRQIKVSLIYA